MADIAAGSRAAACVDARAVRAVMLDIEGTVTDVRFVRERLFPYARERLADFLAARRADRAVLDLLADVRALAGVPSLDFAGTVDLLQRWTDEDRKATPLKQLQGWIWAAGYAAGELVAPLYPDVVPALRAWRAGGLDLHVYSSGSVDAQQLLFAHTADGDVSALLAHYFDTRVGPKTAVESYRAIARALALNGRGLLFLSDHPGEVAAARAAGWQAVRVERDGTLAGAKDAAIGSFEELVLV